MKRYRYRRISIWTLIIAILTLLGAGVTQKGQVVLPTLSSQPGFYPVTHVTDGDTIEVNLAGKNEIVRLIGIDTPEEKDPRKPVQCYALAAAQHMQQLAGDKSVRLEADPDTSDRDKYNRLLRYVYLSDGTFVNQAQVQQGYGFAYTIFPNSKLDQFRAWEREARGANRGLWAGCQIHSEGEKEQTNDQ
ncbi:MAG TPA: thermonuclease family protein [Candidatus Saccharimonadales bacterium]|nr:thermonuclease family protein [Candidatus Saccharimonadales bacterium]